MNDAASDFSSATIILPTFNEAGHIVRLVQELLEHVPGARIIVVDDNSPDGTADAVRSEFPGSPVDVVVRTSAPGLAVSILEGVRRSTSAHLVVMDTDFSHDPSLVPVMLRNLAWFDVVTGSRYVHGGGMYSNARYTFSYLFNMSSRFVLESRLTDHLSGFFAARREALDELDRSVGLDRIFTGYGDYFIRMLFHLVRAKKAILEVPSWYRDRVYGESKTRFLATLVRYTATVLRLRLSHGRAWTRPVASPR